MWNTCLTGSISIVLWKDIGIRMDNNKKTNIGLIIVDLVIAVAYAAAAALLSLNHSKAFWVSYVVTILILLAQIAIWPVIKGEKEEIIFKYPQMRIGYGFSVIQIVFSIVAPRYFFLDASFPIFLAIQIVLVAAYVVLAIIVGGGTRYIKKVEQNATASTKISLMWSLTSEDIYNNLKGTALEKKAKELHEETLYSNPKPNPQCSDLEKAIADKLDSLLKLSMVQDGVKEEMINDYLNLIKKRNRICQSYK